MTTQAVAWAEASFERGRGDGPRPIHRVGAEQRREREGPNGTDPTNSLRALARIAVERSGEKGLGLVEAANQVWQENRFEIRTEALELLAVRGFASLVQQEKSLFIESQLRQHRNGRKQGVNPPRSLLATVQYNVGGIQKPVLNYSLADVDFIINSCAAEATGWEKRQRFWEDVRAKMLKAGREYITGLPVKMQNEIAEAIIGGEV